MWERQSIPGREGGEREGVSVSHDGLWRSCLGRSSMCAGIRLRTLYSWYRDVDGLVKSSMFVKFKLRAPAGTINRVSLSTEKGLASIDPSLPLFALSVASLPHPTSFGDVCLGRPCASPTTARGRQSSYIPKTLADCFVLPPPFIHLR